MASAHRPRRKRQPQSSSGAVTAGDEPSFPLVAFFWPLKGVRTSPWITLPIVLLVAFLFRWCTALWPYSGQASPPLHGDFEAQRHWLEITANLPVTHWYFHDLEWWGLDYPPLTAYHSWLLGYIGCLVNPEWFQLYLSRGLDDAGLKVFMRATVVASEFAVYIPAVVLCVRQLRKLYNVNSWESSIALAAILMQPATILIDHGHFQYNTVMLGFTTAAIASLLAGRRLWACVFFVAALGFKQMALFYAPCIAASLAGSCLFPRIDIPRLAAIAIVTLASFVVLFLPLLLGTAYDTQRNIALPSSYTAPALLTSLPWPPSEKAWYYPCALQLAQAVHRIFPFARGLFEDKVANIWCALHASGLHKLHRYAPETLSRAALALTLLLITPPCAIIFFRPKQKLILPALAATAWAFFLAGFQVHEKNVLLPLLPMTLLLATVGGMSGSTRAWVGFANMLAGWTMFPLLARDQLRIPYAVLMGLWSWLLGIPPFDISAYTAGAEAGGPNIWTGILHVGAYAGMMIWHAVEAFVAPPTNKPDLWVVANVCLGAAGFGTCYLWCLWRLLEESELLYDSGLLRSRQSDARKKKQ